MTEEPASTPQGAEGLVRRDDAVRQTSHLERLAVHEVKIELAGRVVAVRLEWATAAEVYGRRYRRLLSTRPPDLTAYAGGWKPGEVYFWIGGGPTYVWLHSQLGRNEIAFLMDAVVNSTVFTSTDDLVALHAATVGNGAAIAAIVGTTTAGKTTTAIACARRGLDLYSDEFCLVMPEGVLACPRALNLREGGIELLAQDAAPQSVLDEWLRNNRGGDRDNVGFDELFGELPELPQLPLRLAFTIVGRDTEPRATPLSAARMVAHVEPWVRMKARGLDAVEALHALVRRVACYELILGRPDDTARLIATMLASVAELRIAS